MERLWRGEADEPVEQGESVEPAVEPTDFWDDILAGEAAAIEAGDDVFRFSDADETEDEDDAAPFDAEVWGRLPERGGPKEKTRGIFVLADGDEMPLISGYAGPSKEIPVPRTGTGMNNINVSHVEAHASALMRLSNGRLTEATLYINNPPCRGSWGCDRNLDRMLPPGAKLTVYFPGDSKVYRGRPLEER